MCGFLKEEVSGTVTLSAVAGSTIVRTHGKGVREAARQESLVGAAKLLSFLQVVCRCSVHFASFVIEASGGTAVPPARILTLLHLFRPLLSKL